MDNKIFKIGLGNYLHRVPFAAVPGVGYYYSRYQKDYNSYYCSSVENRKQIIFNKVREIVAFAIENVPFYKEFYEKKGFYITELHGFDDISKIPIIRKEDLMYTPLELSSVNKKSHILHGFMKLFLRLNSQICCFFRINSHTINICSKKTV